MTSEEWRLLENDEREPFSGGQMLIAAVMSRAYTDLRNRSPRHRASAAWYFGSELFERHAEAIGLDADWVREKLVADLIPDCPLKTIRLGELHRLYTVNRLTIARAAARGNVDEMALAHAWGLMGLGIWYEPNPRSKSKRRSRQRPASLAQFRVAQAAQQVYS